VPVRLHARVRSRFGKRGRNALNISKIGRKITQVMAVTKVSSTLHFLSRNSAVSGPGETPNGRWTPHTDVYVSDNSLVIKVELAGMKSDSLEIIVEGQRLRITGVRPDCCRGPHCNFLVMEINYGPFETVLDLPAGYDLARAKALYVNGFLRVDVPPAHQQHIKTTKVPISEGA
jgi:HSP20 family protein